MDVCGEPRAVGWARSVAATAKRDKRTLVDESLRREPEQLVAIDILLPDSGIGLGSTGKRVEAEIERSATRLVGWKQVVSKKGATRQNALRIVCSIRTSPTVAEIAMVDDP